jgi:hypothetical protein
MGVWNTDNQRGVVPLLRGGAGGEVVTTYTRMSIRVALAFLGGFLINDMAVAFGVLFMCMATGSWDADGRVR